MSNVNKDTNIFMTIFSKEEEGTGILYYFLKVLKTANKQINLCQLSSQSSSVENDSLLPYPFFGKVAAIQTLYYHSDIDR